MKYSNNSQIQEIVEELIDRGFVYDRAGNHGKLFTPENKYVCVIPGSPSDHRAPLNFKAEVRRYLRAHNMEPLSEDMPRLLVRKPFNSIQIEFPKIQPKPVEAPVEKKRLTVEAIPLLKELIAGGKKIPEIAQIVAGMGYVTKTGEAPNRGSMAQFISYHGIGKLQSKRKAEAEAEETPVVAAPVQLPTPPPVVVAPAPIIDVKKYPILEEVTEIISSNLPDHLKEKYLEMVVQKRSGN